MLSKIIYRKIMRLDSSIHALLRLRKRTKAQDRQLSDKCREALRLHEDVFFSHTLKKHQPTAKQQKQLTSLARTSMLYLGGFPDPDSVSLKDYEHKKYGPYLGISDEGSAAHIIRDAALNSPKMKVLGWTDPIVVGVAHDAERLGAIGEVPVGPEEYIDIRLECIGRILTSTNVGTRLNLRYYKHYPEVYLGKGTTSELIKKAKRQLKYAFEPFVKTPDGSPRPLIVFIRFFPKVQNRTTILTELVRFVAKGEIAIPKYHRLGLLAKIPYGRKGKATALWAINLARKTGLKDVAIDGYVRSEARGHISSPGLLNFLPPGLVGPVLRHAKANGIAIYSKYIVDPDTVARNVWCTLNSARHMGLELGKYGTFPLTLEECDEVIGKVQKWFIDWTAAPVFFVDRGILDKERVYVRRDVVAGLKAWLKIIEKHKVPVVLIDTVDKSKGWRLLRTRGDRKGLLGPLQIQELDRFAADRGIKVLWAGGISLAQTYEFGKMGVFGIYVTSATASKEPVSIEYERDPMLASLKEPTAEGVSRTKMLLETGFLVSRLRGTERAKTLERTALSFIQSFDELTRLRKNGKDGEVKRMQRESQRAERELVEKAVAAWKVYLKGKK